MSIRIINPDIFNACAEFFLLSYGELFELYYQIMQSALSILHPAPKSVARYSNVIDKHHKSWYSECLREDFLLSLRNVDKNHKSRYIQCLRRIFFSVSWSGQPVARSGFLVNIRWSMIFVDQAGCPVARVAISHSLFLCWVLGRRGGSRR